MQNKLNKLSREILQICDKNKITISSAESCTGGLISQYFTSHPGSSKVFLGGFVTYSNNSKIKILNVKEETLKNYGAVSENTVIEMSEAAKIILNTDISLAVSGIAGPDGGSKDKPVGLVHHCVSNLENKNIHRKIIHVGNREDIRNKTAETIFYMILEQILQI